MPPLERWRVGLQVLNRAFEIKLPVHHNRLDLSGITDSSLALPASSWGSGSGHFSWIRILQFWQNPTKDAYYLLENFFIVSFESANNATNVQYPNP
jgi:hypothetical protein